MNKEKKQYRTSQIWIKKGHRMHEYFRVNCENSKNISNTTNFYIRQIYTALKNENGLHPLQQEVMDTLSGQLPLMNDRQLNAYRKKVEKENRKPVEDRKEVKANLFEMPTKEKAMVSYGLLDCLFKTMDQDNYKALPLHSAQGMMPRCVPELEVVLFQPERLQSSSGEIQRTSPDSRLLQSKRKRNGIFQSGMCHPGW